MYKANPEIQGKVEEILKDPDTKDWIDTIGSESARINYIKHLAEYLIHRKSTVQNLVANFKKDENKEIKSVQSFVNEMLKRLAPGTVANYVSAIKSRMQYDGIPFTRSVKIPNRDDSFWNMDDVIKNTPRILEHYICTNVLKEELNNLYEDYISQLEKSK